jgi:hypothetical protein
MELLNLIEHWLLSTEFSKVSQVLMLIQLIIIDSVSFVFRYCLSDLSLRMRLLNRLGHVLMELATKHSIAVVCTNPMTTQWGDEGIDGDYSHQLQPALGNKMIIALGRTWGMFFANRILFKKEVNNSMLFWIDCSAVTMLKIWNPELKDRLIYRLIMTVFLFSHYKNQGLQDESS